MIESDMRFLNPAPHALPGNVLALVVTGLQLFTLRTLRQRRRVTIPAGANVRDGSHGATLDRDVTVHASELHVADVDIVRKGDGLLRFRPISDEMRHRLRDRRMSGRDDILR